MKIVVGFSGGVSSAWCAGWALRQFPKESVVFLFHDTKEEDPDTYRFIRQMAEALDHPVTERSDGRSVTEVFYDENAIANNRMAFCSRILKAEQRDRYFAELRASGETEIWLVKTQRGNREASALLIDNRRASSEDARIPDEADYESPKHREEDAVIRHILDVVIPQALFPGHSMQVTDAAPAATRDNRSAWVAVYKQRERRGHDVIVRMEAGISLDGISKTRFDQLYGVIPTIVVE